MVKIGKWVEGEVIKKYLDRRSLIKLDSRNIEDNSYRFLDLTMLVYPDQPTFYTIQRIWTLGNPYTPVRTKLPRL